jgi:restriction system protein
MGPERAGFSLVLVALAVLLATPHRAGLLLFLGALGGGLALWALGYGRRRKAAEALNDQRLYQQLEFTKIDAMTWQQFEQYCADLLQARGYQEISKTGSTRDYHGADIIATDPDGHPVAVQCKQWKGRVGPNVVRELIGTVNSGKHQGRAGILMTNAPVTPGAQQLAGNHEILVVDQVVLQQWMTQARDEIEQRGNRIRASAPRSRPDGMHPVAAAVLCGTLSIVIFGVFPPKLPKTQAMPTQPGSQPVLTAPEKVVTEYFADISKHNWPAVCGMWRHSSPCRGPGYQRMISGFRLTARDVVTNLAVHGDAVAARVLAHETTGAIQRWAFQYKVQNGEITWGKQQLLGTIYPKRMLHKRPVNPRA